MPEKFAIPAMIHPVHLLFLSNDPAEAALFQERLEIPVRVSLAEAGRVPEAAPWDLIVVADQGGAPAVMHTWRRLRQAYPRIPVVVFSDLLDEAQAAQVWADALSLYADKRQPACLEPILRRALGAASGQALADTRKALEEVEYRLADITESLPGGIYQFVGKPDGGFYFSYLSERCSEITGITQWGEGTSAEQDFARVLPEDLPGVLESIQVSAAGLRPWDQQFRMVSADGGIRWLRGSSMPRRREDGGILWTGIFFDITAHKVQARALAQAQSFSAAVLDIVGALVIVMDRRGRVVELNRACERLTGYQVEEILGGPVWLLLPPDQRTAVQGVFANLTAGQFPNTYENHWLTKDGRLRLIAWSNTCLADDQGQVTHVIATGIDVTEERATQALLDQQRNELERLVAERTTRVETQARIIDQIHDAVVSTDLDGRVTSWNKGAERLFGYGAEEAMGRHVSILHKDEPAFLERHIIAPLQARGMLETEALMLRKDGEEFFAYLSLFLSSQADGSVTGMIGYVVDISERKRAEAAMALYARAMAASSVGIVIADATQPDMPLIYVNPAFEWISGHPGTEVLGRNCRFLQGAEHDQPGLAEIRAALREGRDGRALLRNYRKDGSPFWNELIVTPVHDANGKLTHFIGISQDVSERQEVADALRRYEFMVNAVADMMSVVNREHRYEAVNDQWCDQFGKSRAEAIGTSLLEIWGETDYREAIAPPLKQCFSDRRPHTLRASFALPRLGRREFSITYYPYGEGAQGAEFVVVVTRDVTEQVLAERALQQSEENLRATLESTADGILVVRKDGGIAFANRRFAEMWRISEELMLPGRLTSNLQDHVEGQLADPAEFRARLKAIYASDDEVQDTLLFANGRVFERNSKPMLKAGRNEGRVWSFRDITARTWSETALRASETRLRTLLDNILDGIIVIDGKGLIESFNPAAERIFGYQAEEVLNCNISMLMPEPYRSAHDGYLQHYQDTGHARIIGIGREVTGRRKDGSVFPMDLAVSEMLIDGRRVFTGVVHDITARKQVQSELVLAKEEAERASRAKSEFLSSMSHELRTPMNAILGFAQLLEIDRALGDEQADSVREILKAGRHLLELINEVLDLSRIEAGKLALRMEPVALDELIDECVTLVEPSVLRQGLNLSRHVAPCINRRVLADRLRLKQVLLNLLTNAIKYNRVGGEIQITCDILGNGRVRISVRDSGPGLSPQQQAELFTAFHRLGRENSAIEGTGIGLVISKRLVELQGGAIGVDSQVGEGSTFWIELPEAESANENPDAEAGSAARTEEDVGALPPAQARRHKVLYVEDNPANLRLVEQILSRRGDIHLLCSEEPMRGLEMARTEQPELILLDINLPNMDGYEVLQRLQADPATRAIPVVAISANAMPVDVARGLEAGFLAYLTKPVDLARLRQAVDRALEDKET